MKSEAPGLWGVREDFPGRSHIPQGLSVRGRMVEEEVLRGTMVLKQQLGVGA